MDIFLNSGSLIRRNVIGDKINVFFLKIKVLLKKYNSFKPNINDMNFPSKSWYALYTRPKNEKKICFYLRQKGIVTFLPMTTEVRQWSDRKKTITMPLFPNYIFVQISKSQLGCTDDISGAIRFIGIGKDASVIPDKVIESLRKIENKKASVEELKLFKGEKVRITNGDFIGVEGEFIRRGAKNLLAIGVEIMNRVVMIELDASQVRKLEPLEKRMKATI